MAKDFSQDLATCFSHHQFFQTAENENSTILPKSSEQYIVLNQTLMAVPGGTVLNQHKSSGKIFSLSLARKFLRFSQKYQNQGHLFLSISWFDLKTISKKHVFKPNFDPKIDSGIFAPKKQNCLRKWRKILSRTWQQSPSERDETRVSQFRF